MSKEQIEEMAKAIDEVSEFIILGVNDAFIKVKMACERAAENLYNAGYRKQSEWISVEDRIPKKWQKCLCYYPEKDYGSKVVVDYAETDNGGFAEQFQFGNPSHWMPLPEAPKKKGE